MRGAGRMRRRVGRRVGRVGRVGKEERGKKRSRDQGKREGRGGEGSREGGTSGGAAPGVSCLISYLRALTPLTPVAEAFALARDSRGGATGADSGTVKPPLEPMNSIRLVPRV